STGDFYLFPALRTLKLGWFHAPELAALQRCSSLTALHFLHCELQVSQLQSIMRLKTLSVLEISKCATLETGSPHLSLTCFADLRHFPSLTELSLVLNRAWSDDEFAMIAAIPS